MGYPIYTSELPGGVNKLRALYEKAGTEDKELLDQVVDLASAYLYGKANAKPGSMAADVHGTEITIKPKAEGKSLMKEILTRLEKCEAGIRTNDHAIDTLSRHGECKPRGGSVYMGKGD